MTLENSTKIFFKKIFENYRELESNKSKIKEWHSNLNLKTDNVQLQLLYHTITKIIRFYYQEYLLVYFIFLFILEIV